MQSAMSQGNARDAASGESCVVSFLLNPSLSAISVVRLEFCLLTELVAESRKDSTATLSMQGHEHESLHTVLAWPQTSSWQFEERAPKLQQKHVRVIVIVHQYDRFD